MHGITCYCPIGLLPHFYLYVRKIHCSDNFCVNALSGCYLISTSIAHFVIGVIVAKCQCPLGLLPHFYVSCRDNKAYSSVHRVNALSGCYLISTDKLTKLIACVLNSVNALSGCYLISTVILLFEMYINESCQCPLGLLPHFYSTPSKT